MPACANLVWLGSRDHHNNSFRDKSFAFQIGFGALISVYFTRCVRSEYGEMLSSTLEFYFVLCNVQVLFVILATVGFFFSKDFRIFRVHYIRDCVWPE